MGQCDSDEVLTRCKCHGARRGGAGTRVRITVCGVGKGSCGKVTGKIGASVSYPLKRALAALDAHPH